MKLDKNIYQHSGRLELALDPNASRNPGFSCNYLRVADNLESISKALDWTLMIATNNGAPSLDFSDLRAKGAPISSGGTSPGPIPFMHAADAVLASAKRNHNKNHAGLIGLSADHPDIKDFLDAEFKIASKVVYFPENYELSFEAAQFFHNYYVKQPKLFFHKRQDGRGTNLCTEILMPNKGTCVLGTFNVAHYQDINELSHNFPYDFASAAMELVKADTQVKARNAAKWGDYVSYDEDNLQVGLSITGLATLIGRMGIHYRDFFDHNISGIFDDAYDLAATRVARYYPHYKRLFCQAPLVHSHRKFRDGVTGLAVTPGLEPLEGAQVGEVKICRIVSQDHGTIEMKHPADTWTVEDVSIDEWMYFNKEYKRRYIDQSISFSVYDGSESFSVGHFIEWFVSPLPSLYYYVPFVPTARSQNIKFEGCPINVSLGKWQHLADACGCAG